MATLFKPFTVPTPTLDRLVPDEVVASEATGAATLQLHVTRYELAAKHAREVGARRVLDLACGVGYGTRLVADAAGAEAVGVDIDAATVAYARDRYGRDGVAYLASDALAFRDPVGFDVVISLETIEHVVDPIAVFAHLVELVRPGGLLVASVPTTPSVDANPHHLHDFTERSFRAKAARHHLVELDTLRQVQAFSPFGVLKRTEARLVDMRPNLAAYYLRHPGAAVRRALATLRYGFTNRYLTVVWRR